jgi:hypothetical protein
MIFFRSKFPYISLGQKFLFINILKAQLFNYLGTNRFSGRIAKLFKVISL